MPPAADSSGAAAPYEECLSPGPVTCRRQHRKVLENRDLCRIVSSYIPIEDEYYSYDNDSLSAR